ncbi:hypothetical protein Nepgr_019794 [Nepenthes gracilis]|uniref:Uncharacterized protein n=1 Tax=Nepenthes gracilis TaxID=150966 RepID=A0AAD3XUQ4_NEPGR|nr:hypothetical protein Nepgr_019794 [Nepenthes gracilis]
MHLFVGEEKKKRKVAVRAERDQSIEVEKVLRMNGGVGPTSYAGNSLLQMDALVGKQLAERRWEWLAVVVSGLLEPGIIIRQPSGHGAPRGTLPAGRGPVLVGERRVGDFLAMLEGGSQRHISRLLQLVSSLCG